MADGKVVISTALDNKGFEKGVSEAKQVLGGLGNAATGSLGGLEKVVRKLGVAIATAFSVKAAVGFVKQSVDAYADYQQLVGGVTTLFKDGANEVVSYAEDAFYRAGVSANKYMETVTSFSASLINALGGDTVKAAQAADMAMVDMADNANKMGTALESIQNAYQGFAKQNYTMLDNLKLGYGGTKEEMQRLLKDAQAITGIKYDINNLADVYSAIHAIQEQLGIAGATAEEAENTISGSAAMTKAAWENVLAAISGGGDLDKAINNLVFSVSKYFQNIVPVVERALSGIGKLIEQVAPQLVQTVAMSLIKAIPSLLNAVYQMIVGLAKGIYQGIVALFTGESREIEAQIKDNASDALGAVTEGYQEAEKATEDAEKAAKRYLAGFDEIQRIGGDDDAETPDTSITTPSIGDVSVGDIVVGGTVDDQASPQIQGILGGIIENIKKMLQPLKDIDFSRLRQSLGGLGGAFSQLGQTIKDALWWAWQNILVPLAQWTIEEGAPAGIDMLSAAFGALNSALRPVLQGLQGLWGALQPIVAFIGDNVITVFNEWETSFNDLAQMFEENGEDIEGIFTGIGDIIRVVWGWIEPILTWQRELWKDVFRLVSDLVIRKIENIIDHVSGMVDFIAGVLTGDWERAWGGIEQIFDGTVTYIQDQANTLLAPLQEVWDGICKAASEAWDAVSKTVSDCWEGIKEFFAPAVEWFDELFGSVEQTLDDIFYNIEVIASGAWDVIKAVWEAASTWFDENIAQPIAEVFGPLWEDLKTGASEVWEGIKEIFGKVGSWFEETFSDAWEAIVGVFSAAGEIFVDIKDGVVSVFKKVVNGLIDGINKVVSVPFNGINDALKLVKDINILGITPFSGLKTINVPQIPKLAQGAVLPANKPFLAMVGDQKHGTNVEAPLATIQEAVAIVMEDMIASNVAGHEATVAVLREILSAVMGIEIGDTVIGQAAARYDRQMAVIRGGV